MVLLFSLYSRGPICDLFNKLLCGVDDLLDVTPKKYWCYQCKAHNSFDHIVDQIVNSHGTRTHQKMSCVRCQASMFQPSQITAGIVGTLGFSLIAIVIGLGLGGDGLLVSWGLAACSGLIGLSMLYYMILWRGLLILALPKRGESASTVPLMEAIRH